MLFRTERTPSSRTCSSDTRVLSLKFTVYGWGGLAALDIPRSTPADKKRPQGGPAVADTTVARMGHPATRGCGKKQIPFGEDNRRVIAVGCWGSGWGDSAAA